MFALVILAIVFGGLMLILNVLASFEVSGDEKIFVWGNIGILAFIITVLSILLGKANF